MKVKSNYPLLTVVNKLFYEYQRIDFGQLSLIFILLKTVWREP